MRASSNPIRGRDLLVLALAFGLLAGYLDQLVVVADHLLLGKLLTRGRHGLWMSPLISALLALGVALPVAAVRRVRGATGFPRGGIFLVMLMASLTVFINYHPRIHIAAVVLLSAGCALQLVRWMSAHPAGTLRWTRRLAAVGVCLTLASAGLLKFWEVRRERAALAQSAAPADAPNILLIIFDTVRSMNVSSYGYGPATTPHLSALARRGVQFDWAISTAPWTTPSHAAIFTGRFGYEHGADWLTPLVDSIPTVGDVLAAQGYRTAGFTGNMIRTGWEFGLDRGFGHFEDFKPSLKQLFNHSELLRYFSRLARVRGFLGTTQVLGRKHADEVAGGFLGWLDRPSDRPFYAFLNFFDVHAPYVPIEPFATQFGVPVRPPALRDRLHGLRYPPKREDHSMARYDANIARVDEWLGRLIEELDRRHLTEKTLIIITADHGEEFNEHDQWGHGGSLYLPALHVPLIAVWPGHLPPDVKVATTVSLRDIGATILDLAGVDNRGRIPGQSLAWSWGSGPAPNPAIAFSAVSKAISDPDVPTAKGDMYSVVVDSFHFIRSGDGAEELYQIHSDPMEASNILTTSPPALVQLLRTRLDAFRAAGGPPGTDP